MTELAITDIAEFAIKQIMNVYECDGKNILARCKIECSIQGAIAELNRIISSFTE